MTVAPPVRPRPFLAVDTKGAAHGGEHVFDEARHPRDDHGRWAHTPGGKRVKIPQGYHVGAQVEVHLPDFSREGAKRGYPMKWHRATVENVTASHESGKTVDVQVRMHEDGRPHVETVGIRGGNKRIRPVADAAPAAVSGAASEPSDVEHAAALALLHGILRDDPKTSTRLPDKGRKDGAGTLDDPIDVGDDLARAATLLAEGKHIRLRQPDQVATLLDKLVDYVNEAEKKGGKVPTLDLCKVSVPGTNLFCKQSKNIPRAQMPQLKGEIVPGSLAERYRTPKGRGDIAQPFRDSLAAMGIPTTRKQMPASHLRATQSELSGSGVANMMQAMDQGLVPEGTIFVSRDGYVIDGHHRWAAKVAIDSRDGKLGDVMMNVEEIDLDIGAAIDYANTFARVMGIRSKGHGESTSTPTLGTKARPRPRLVVDGTLPLVTKASGGRRSSRIAHHIDAVYRRGAVTHAINLVYAAGTQTIGAATGDREGKVAPSPVPPSSDQATPPDAPADAAGSSAPDGAGSTDTGSTGDDHPHAVAHLAQPAPGEEPVGAYAFLASEDGTEAWLAVGPDGTPVGYLRDSSQPLRAVRINDIQAWADIVDSLGLQEQPVPDSRVPAPGSEDDAEPGDVAQPDGSNALEGSDAADAADGPDGESAPPKRGARAEGKSARGDFDEAKHPRDRHGRFIHIGDHVDLGGGTHGRVTGTTAGGKLQVTRSDGKTVSVDAHTVAKTAGGAAGGGSAPHLPDAPNAPSEPHPSGGGRTAADAIRDVTGTPHGPGAGDSSVSPSALSDEALHQALHSGPASDMHSTLHDEATRRAQAKATAIIGKVSKVEPGVTKTLQGMASQNGGRMEGLEFRIKTNDSLTRKIRDKSLLSGKTQDEVAGKIGDALRYTMILDENHYADGAGGTLKQLQSQGMTIIDQDNSWHPGNTYQGLNTVLRTSDGTMFELQFHTQASFDVKMSTHEDYELARDPAASLEERLGAWYRMVDVQSKVPVPTNVQSVGNLRVYEPPKTLQLLNSYRGKGADMTEQTADPAAAPEAGPPAAAAPTSATPAAASSTSAVGGADAGARRFYALYLLGDTDPYAIAAKAARGVPERWVPGQGWVDMPALADYFYGEDPGIKEITPEQAHTYMQQGLGKLGEGVVEQLRGAQ